MLKASRWAVLAAVLLTLTGCETAKLTLQDVQASAANSIPAKKGVKLVRATGYAPISLQRGETRQQKIVNAIRASKLSAYRELVGVVHGQYLFGSNTVSDLVLQNDEFRTAVAGVVRGAQVVKSYPVQQDTYATILEVDMNQLEQAWLISSDL